MVKLAQVGPTASGFYRVLLGGLGLLALVLARRERLWAGWRPLAGALAAGLFFALDLFFWHRSILYVGPGLATILANFQVFILAGAGVLMFGERPGWRLAAAIPLAVLGLFMVVAQDWVHLGPEYRLGVVFGLVTALCYACYLLTLRGAMRRQPTLGATANVALISLICAGLLALEMLNAGESFAVPTAADWGWLLIYGLACHALGWVLISRGLGRIPASRAGLSLLLQPTLSFVWDMLLFARPTTALEAAGAALALGAIYLGSLSRPEQSG
ncbi:MAG: DMT family transporter [Desulfarculus sp.]|nr:MAG: DMT family transporter [Desulfarculus sp.]